MPPYKKKKLMRIAEADTELEASRVCLHCWHGKRQVFLEDEAHIIISCPRYHRERQEMWSKLTHDTLAELRSPPGSQEQMLVLLRSHRSQDWRAFARFIARITALRRRLRLEFQQRSQHLAKNGLANKRSLWRSKGLAVCRHGTFFQAPTDFQCSCLNTDIDADVRWHTAE